MRRSTIAALATLAALLLPVGAPALADPLAVAPPAPVPAPLPVLPSPSATAITTATPSPTPSSARSAAPGPGTVRSLAWQAVEDGVRLRWEAPAGAPAGTTYTVVVHGAGTADLTRSTATTWLELARVPAGARLTAAVTATAGGTAGPAAEAPSWVVPAVPPRAPAAATLAVARDRRALRVTWTPPPTQDGTTITGFVVELRTVAAPDVVAARRAVPASARSVLFASPAPGIRYFATVAAVGAGGVGADRETPTALLRTPAAAPCAACEAVGGTPQHVVATPAARPSAVAAAPRASNAAAVSAVPTRGGMPWRLTLGIGGIVLAAGLAVAAVLLRRRSALG